MVQPTDCLRILVTSAVPGEGKSTTALSLARLLQRSGKRVALLECDLRRPRLAKELARGLHGERTRGLVDLLRGETGIADVIQTDPASGATMVLAGAGADDSMFLLKSPPMRELVDWITSHHDVVVLDSPPVLPIADARVLTDLVDVTLLLCRWGSTRKESCLAAIRTLRQPGSPPLAVAMSQVDVKRYAHYDSTYSQAQLQHYYRN
jgi:capsular exopolysaccharide synthesis family protein